MGDLSDFGEDKLCFKKMSDNRLDCPVEKLQIKGANIISDIAPEFFKLQPSYFSAQPSYFSLRASALFLRSIEMHTFSKIDFSSFHDCFGECWVRVNCEF